MAYQPYPVPVLCADLINKRGKIESHISEKIWRNKLYNEEVDHVPVEYFKVPFGGLKDGVNTLLTMTEQIKELLSFVNLSPRAKEFESILGEEIEWAFSDDLSISFTYIEEKFCKRVSDQIDSLLAGKVQYATLLKRYTDASEVDELARSFYGSTVPRYVPLKDIGGRRSNIKVLVLSENALKGTVLNFLENLLYCNLNPSSKYNSVSKGNYKDIINRVKIDFERLYDTLLDMNMSAIKAAKLSASGIDTSQINTLFNYIFNDVFSIEGRIIVLLYRTISAATANVRNMYLVYRRVVGCKNGLDTNILEEVEEDEVGDAQGLSLTNHTLMVSAAKSLLSAAVNAYGWIDHPTLQTMMNKKMAAPFYDAVEKFFFTIDTRTRNMKSGLEYSNTDREEVPFSTVLETYKLIANPDAYLQWIDENCLPYSGGVCESEELPIADYMSDIGTLLTMLTSNARTIQCTVNRLATLKTDIRHNVNNAYGYITNRDSALEWCDAMINMLGKANVKLGWLFRKRLYKISEKLPIIVPYSSTSIALDHGYFPLHPLDDIDVMVNYEEDCAIQSLSRINQKYMQLYTLKQIGIPYFEAEDNAGTSTKPQVHDNSGGDDNKSTNGDKPKETDNANTDNNKEDQNNETKSSGKIVDRVLAQIRKLKEILEKLVSDGAKEKNLKFLTDNRDFLISRNYTNTAIDILPYIDNDRYDELLKGWIDKASQITETTLRTADESAIRNAIFTGFAMPKGKNGIESDLVHGLKVGTAELAVKSISDNALKEKIPKMISFCEFYYNTLSGALDSIERDNVKKLSALDDKKAASESDTDRTEKNKALIAQMLKSAVNAVRYASRDRCNDYLSILSSLASSNKKAGKKDTPQKDNSSNEEKKA